MSAEKKCFTATILPLGPRTEITPKVERQPFGPLFRSTNVWKVCGQPTTHGKKVIHVLFPNRRSKIDGLLKPCETPYGGPHCQDTKTGSNKSYFPPFLFGDS